MKDETIIKNLKTIMNRRGISQRELANIIGKDETVISRWFAGKVGISGSSVKLLESALGEKLVNTDNRKRALITGVTGQDGSYLSEFLIEKGYDVHWRAGQTLCFRPVNANIKNIFYYDYHFFPIFFTKQYFFSSNQQNPCITPPSSSISSSSTPTMLV